MKTTLLVAIAIALASCGWVGTVDQDGVTIIPAPGPIVIPFDSDK